MRDDRPEHPRAVFVLWDPEGLNPERLRAHVLGPLADRVREAGATTLWALVRDDRAAQVPSPTPFPLGVTCPSAVIVAVLPEAVDVDALAATLTGPLEAVAYRAASSTYTAFGGNPHGRARDWPDGVVSPGVVPVSFLRRPPSMTVDAWIDAWHGRMSPVSERIQPRARYVRHRVVGRPEGLPRVRAFDAIVEEAFPSAEHVRDPFRFYGADGPVALVRNMGAILVAVAGIARIWEIQTVVMSHTFLLTPESPS